MMGLLLGASSALRHFGSRSALSGMALFAALCVVAGSLGSGYANRGLYVVFRYMIPISIFVLVGIVPGRELRLGTWSVARFGAARIKVAMGQLLATAVVGAALALFATWTVLAFGHGPGAHLVDDLLVSSWIAALSAFAYVAVFGCAASFGRTWLVIVFVVDFLLGQGGFFGVLLPRGHIANLLGFEAPLGISQAASSTVLLVMVILFGSAQLARARDR